MKPIRIIVLALPILIGCGEPADNSRTNGGGKAPGAPGAISAPAANPPPPTASGPETLADARKGFQTNVIPRDAEKEAAPEPPPRVFRIVHYDSPVGKLVAYLTPDPGKGKQLPAIIWITGGDCNTIGDVWSPAPATNDQTAAAYRKAGIVMMFPSLRGGNDNPGAKEGFFGELDDILAAEDFLAKQSYVDPRRIYLGGHSTGGTMVLLAAEYSDHFRAVISFGPVGNIKGYGQKYLPFDFALNPREFELRAPARWLGSIKTPTFVFEGGDKPSNISSLQAMARASTNANVHFFPVAGVNHFSILARVNRLIADKILRDTGPSCDLTVSNEELSRQ